MTSTLISRNLTISGHRTSVRLEPVMWDALAELCRRENTTVHTVCSEIKRTSRASSLTAAIRAYLVSYFRSAATEFGHMQAGHGRSRASGMAANPASLHQLATKT